jgi:ribonuclease HI
MEKCIEIFTDGAAKGNPGNGGYGVVMRLGTFVKEFSQGFRLTTNNRMELLAVIIGLESLKTSEFKIKVYSDSKYVIDSINLKWVFSWEKKNFKGKKNEDLWRRFLKVYSLYNIEFFWVKGHNGHPENERCDFLAVKASEAFDLLVDEWYESNRD